VIGGSVGGLFAAHLLRSAGWEAVVFERATGDLGDRGTGIGTRPELFAAMRRIGLSGDATTGTAVRGRIGLGRDGRVVHERHIPAVTSAWSRIWRPLRQALPDGCYRGGHALVRIEQDGPTVRARFADGSAATGDLLVAADGLHSTARAQLLPDRKPQYAGYVAWRGVVEERGLAPALHETMFDRMIFGFPDGELMLSLPMPGPDDGPHRGERRCHFVWFRPVAGGELGALCTDASGRSHGVAIPPPLIRPELLAALKRDAEALLAPQLAALVHATAQIILQPVFELESPRIAVDRVALVGDAAFVARPHVASGVMKAALDAESLAAALSAHGDDIAAALARYESERQPYGAWLVARGRRIGAIVAARDPDPQRRIETLMREYGAAGVVDDRPIAARLPG
jgi:2-polyprenyl-6-methoxyphenol hydroxylase-like FAD-dependent oxidoreductase